MRTLQIQSPYFTVGLILRKERVVRTPPIVHYMLNWHFSQVMEYCSNKGWSLFDATDPITKIIEQEENNEESSS